MNMFKRNLLTAMIMAGFATPIAALAEEAAPTPAPDIQASAAMPDPAERINLMQAIRTRMHEMMHTQDADKRKELMSTQMKDMDALMEMGGPDMGMMMGRGMKMAPMAMGAGPKDNCKTGQGMVPGMGMGMGPGMGMGMMMGAGGKKPCKTNPGGHCPPRDAALDHRLDSMEKRMDMMQMMLQSMMRN